MAEVDEVDRWAGNEVFAETLVGAQGSTLRRVLATWVQGVGADSAESWSCIDRTASLGRQLDSLHLSASACLDRQAAGFSALVCFFLLGGCEAGNGWCFL